MKNKKNISEIFILEEVNTENQQCIEEVKFYIQGYESYRCQNQAQHFEAKYLFKRIEDWFLKSPYEFCGHNAALLGWKMYNDCIFKNRKNNLITKQDYKILWTGYNIYLKDLNDNNFKSIPKSFIDWVNFSQ